MTETKRRCSANATNRKLQKGPRTLKLSQPFTPRLDMFARSFQRLRTNTASSVSIPGTCEGREQIPWQTLDLFCPAVVWLWTGVERSSGKRCFVFCQMSERSQTITDCLFHAVFSFPPPPFFLALFMVNVTPQCCFGEVRIHPFTACIHRISGRCEN